jgi:protein-disulfide isomerase
MPADWRRGVDEAKVVLVEYGDYQCAACAQYHSMIEEAMAEYGNRIAFVYRHFPLRDIHRHAGLAARAAEAAGRQGKFWEMHNLLYRRQDEWATTLNAQAVFEYYAQSLGLDRSRFLRDLDDDALRGKVENDFQSGVRAEVSGTPASYLQGKQFPYPSSYVELRALLEEALRAADSLGGKKEPTAVAPNTIVSGP